MFNASFIPLFSAHAPHFYSLDESITTSFYSDSYLCHSVNIRLSLIHFLSLSPHPLNLLQKNEDKLWGDNWALTWVRAGWMKTDDKPVFFFFFFPRMSLLLTGKFNNTVSEMPLGFQCSEFSNNSKYLYWSCLFILLKSIIKPLLPVLSSLSVLSPSQFCLHCAVAVDILLNMIMSGTVKMEAEHVWKMFVWLY